MISAAAIKCLGGQLLGRLWPRDDEERQAAVDAGYDLDEVLDRDDLVGGDDGFFAATGVTDGDSCRACATTRTVRDDRVARHALALGHRPHGSRRATTGEAARGHGRPLRLSRVPGQAGTGPTRC